MKILLRFRDREILARLDRLQAAMADDPELKSYEANRSALLRLLIYTGAERLEDKYGLGKD